MPISVLNAVNRVISCVRRFFWHFIILSIISAVYLLTRNIGITLSVSIFLLALVSQVSSLTPTPMSRPLAILLLVGTVFLTATLITVQYFSEKENQYDLDLLRPNAEDHLRIPFRIIVHPDRTTHSYVSFGDQYRRPLYTSWGPHDYCEVMIWGAGTTEPQVLGAAIASYFQSRQDIIGKNGEVTRAAPHIPLNNVVSVDELILDVAQLTLIYWAYKIQRVLPSHPESAKVDQKALGVDLGASLRKLSIAAPENRYLHYLSSIESSKHERLSHAPMMKPFTHQWPLSFNISRYSDPISQHAAKSRLIQFHGTGYRALLRIELHEPSVLKRPAALGIRLKYNTYDLPHVMTENFMINATIVRTPVSQEVAAWRELYLSEFFDLLRRDFDWNIYRDSLLMTRNHSVQDEILKNKSSSQ